MVTSFEEKSIMELTHRVIMNTYARQPIVIDRGQGSYVWDLKGKKYLDFLTGISVNNMGHSFEPVVKAVKNQADKLFHCSNIYYTEPSARLAEKLISLTFADRVFFSNSGAEANEAALKLIRRFSGIHKGEASIEVICMKKSFHGRTFGCMSATGQEKIRQGYEPLLSGFRFVPFGNLEVLKNAITPKTAAIFLEPIQGEGGVHLPPKGYLKGLRELCDSKDILLVLDEIQVGMGRTGKFCAYEWEDVKPDIMTMAKALGGGLPLGACLATQKVSETFVPGSHATTFGANPVACSAGLAMVNAVSDITTLQNCQAMGEHLKNELNQLSKKYDFIKEIRARGLMVGMEFDFEIKELVKTCLEHGLLVNMAGSNTLRILPPLNLQTEELQEGLELLKKVLKTVN